MPKATSAGQVDLELLVEGELFDEFAVLWLLLHASRFRHPQTGSCVLDPWKEQAQEAGERVLGISRQRRRGGAAGAQCMPAPQPADRPHLPSGGDWELDLTRLEDNRQALRERLRNHDLGGKLRLRFRAPRCWCCGCGTSCTSCAGRTKAMNRCRSCWWRNASPPG